MKGENFDRALMMTSGIPIILYRYLDFAVNHKHVGGGYVKQSLKGEFTHLPNKDILKATFTTSYPANKNYTKHLDPSYDILV